MTVPVLTRETIYDTSINDSSNRFENIAKDNSQDFQSLVLRFSLGPLRHIRRYSR